MSSNVGLSTPRGSGTSGYVQRNLSALKVRDTPYPSDGLQNPSRLRQPDAEILRHERAREIEMRVLEFRDGLEEAMEAEKAKLKSKKASKPSRSRSPSPLTDETIDARCDALRDKLTKEAESDLTHSRNPRSKNLKSYQVHELAQAKIEESERLRRALGIREGAESIWDRKKAEPNNPNEKRENDDRPTKHDSGKPKQRTELARPTEPVEPETRPSRRSRYRDSATESDSSSETESESEYERERDQRRRDREKRRYRDRSRDKSRDRGRDRSRHRKRDRDPKRHDRRQRSRSRSMSMSRSRSRSRSDSRDEARGDRRRERDYDGPSSRGGRGRGERSDERERARDRDASGDRDGDGDMDRDRGRESRHR